MPFYCIETKSLTPLAMSQYMMYAYCYTMNTTTLSYRCRSCLESRTITWNVRKCNNNNRDKCKPDYTCSMCKEKTYLYTPSYAIFCK